MSSRGRIPQKKEYNKGHAKKPVYQNQSLEFRKAHITTQIYKQNSINTVWVLLYKHQRRPSKMISESEKIPMLCPSPYRHLIKHLLSTKTENGEMDPTKNPQKMLEPSVTTRLIELK